MKQYQDMLRHILDNGIQKGDRTGNGTRSVFGYQMRFDLSKGFPLVTTKRTSFSNIKHELQWFLNGDTNIKYLKDHKVKIWNEWADENGDLGPIYGAQWRSWQDQDGNAIDQIANVIEELKVNPDSRRLLVSAWNPTVLPDANESFSDNVAKGKQALPPCHTIFQFYVANGELSCQLYQRSADAFLGVPYNIASYALLTHWIAMKAGLQVGEFIHTFGDLHIYNNHMDQVNELLTRKPLNLPRLILQKHMNVADANLYEYEFHPPIKAPIAV